VTTFSLASKINRTISYEGQEYLLFSGTAYLGMASLEAFGKLVLEGGKKYGLNHGWSRGNNVQLTIYEEFERFFALKAGAEKSLVFSSGYLAGRAALAELKKNVDIIYAAPDTHSAILPEDMVLTNSTYDDWKRKLVEELEQLQPSRVLILSNAINALHPEIYDFHWINHLPKKHEYTLLIDDSHAFGVVGEGIFGTYSQWKDLSAEVIVSGSLNKGLCLPAGIVLGNKIRLNEISRQAIFRSSSPPTPGNIYAFLAAQTLYEKQSLKLKELLTYAKSLLFDFKGITQAGRLPVFAFDDSRWVEVLEKHHILVSSFPYPSPNDAPINRIVFSAHHEKSDLWKLHSILTKEFPSLQGKTSTF
jgi:8-amino-7-oxononanoate synthase